MPGLDNINAPYTHGDNFGNNSMNIQPTVPSLEQGFDSNNLGPLVIPEQPVTLPDEDISQKGLAENLGDNNLDPEANVPSPESVDVINHEALSAAQEGSLKIARKIAETFPLACVGGELTDDKDRPLFVMDTLGPDDSGQAAYVMTQDGYLSISPSLSGPATNSEGIKIVTDQIRQNKFNLTPIIDAFENGKDLGQKVIEVAIPQKGETALDTLYVRCTKDDLADMLVNRNFKQVLSQSQEFHAQDPNRFINQALDILDEPSVDPEPVKNHETI